MATNRCGQLRHIFDSPNIGPRLKLHLYTVVVCSLMTYGCESWTLTDKVKHRLNGDNSQMLSHITGNSVQVESKKSHDKSRYHQKYQDNAYEAAS